MTGSERTGVAAQAGAGRPRGVSRRGFLAGAFIVAFVAPAAAQGGAAPFSLFRRSSPPAAPRRTIPRDHGPSTREEVAWSGGEPPGTITVDTQARYLYLVTAPGRALRYRVGIGREGFGWTGVVHVGAKAEWPAWRPPAEMRRRDPSLPDYMPPGPFNPLGARALYLHKGGVDTLYRIHGTNERGTIGGADSSGCFRLTNTDVLDLYQRVRIGARVIVY